jgi:ADP-heptose:LPS heptosyltransferase
MLVKHETENLKIKDVKKIAVLRANALGDFIVTLPALKAMRDAYLDAEIVLLGRAWHKEFLIKRRTAIDRVIEVPLKKGVGDQEGADEANAELELFFEAMQKEHFDIAINFQGNGISSNPFIRRLHAKTTIGAAAKDAEKLDRSIPYYYYQSEVIRFIEVAKLIGAEATSLEPEIKVLEQDEEEISSLIHELVNKSYIVLQTGAVDKRRMWPPQNYPLLADALKQKNFEIIFIGSAEEKNAVDDIIEQMKYPALNTCGMYSLGGLTALLSKATLVIGADTGPMHLARAVNTPTVGIYWAPNLINWGPLTRSIHRPVVSWNMACPYCGIIPNDPYPFKPQTNCTHEVSFVRDVTVQQVLDEAEELLPAVMSQKTTFQNKSHSF